MKRKKTNPYNIYKIDYDYIDKLQNYLLENNFIEKELLNCENKIIDNFTIKLYFLEKQKNGIEWINYLSNYFNLDNDITISIYGAAVLFINKKNKFCYIISYGNAHFYLNDYCDNEFGEQIAERFLDLDKIKSQATVSLQSSTSKTIKNNKQNVPLNYKMNEFPSFIQAKSKEKSLGKNIICGNSVNMRLTDDIINLCEKFNLIDQELQKEPEYYINKLNDIKDKCLIKDLNKKLVDSILSFNEDSFKKNDIISIPYFDFSGIELIQTDIINYKIKWNGKNESGEELTIENICKFINKYNQSSLIEIDDIRIKIEYNNGQWTTYKPITNYLEFLSDNYILIKGKWKKFNFGYREQLINYLSGIKINHYIEEEPWIFKKHINGKNQTEDEYNEKLAKGLSCKVIHKDMQQINGYSIEIADLKGEDKLFFVKIGNTGDFSYAISQIKVTLNTIINNNLYNLHISNDILKTTEVHLVLVFKNRKNKVNDLNDLNSLNFMLSLVELKEILKENRINLVIDFVYAID